jgi:predicted O-methyltransferase YrrM
VGGIPTSTTDDERAALTELAAGRRVLELGSQFGATTKALAVAAEVVYAVDHHRGDPVSGQWDTLADFLAVIDREVVVPLVGSMDQVFPILRPQSFDFVFIDSGKETEQEIQAQAAWAETLATVGGTIAFHDFGRFPVIDRALDARFGKPRRLVDTLAVYEPAP